MKLYNELNKRKRSEYIGALNLGRAAFAVGKEQEARYLFTKAYQEKNPILTSVKQLWPDSRVNKFMDPLVFPKR